MLNEGRLKQSKPLTEAFVKELVGQMGSTFSDNRFHFVRLPPTQKDRVQRYFTMAIEESEVDFNILQHRGKDRIDTEILKLEPVKHTIVFLDQLWRAAKTLCDDYAGVNYDHSLSDSVTSQSLVGRFCGHFKKTGTGAPIIYCNLPSVKRFISLFESDYNYTTVNYSSANITVKDQVIKKIKASYVNSEMFEKPERPPPPAYRPETEDEDEDEEDEDEEDEDELSDEMKKTIKKWYRGRRRIRHQLFNELVRKRKMSKARIIRYVEDIGAKKGRTQYADLRKERDFPGVFSVEQNGDIELTNRVLDFIRTLN